MCASKTEVRALPAPQRALPAWAQDAVVYRGEDRTYASEGGLQSCLCYSTTFLYVLVHHLS
jgi:hypothetical protein